MLCRFAVYLMLQRAVLSFCLFTDDDQVQVVVARAVTRQAIHMYHVCKKVQFTPKNNTGCGLVKEEKRTHFHQEKPVVVTLALPQSHFIGGQLSLELHWSVNLSWKSRK